LDVPVHNSATMSDWTVTRQIKLIKHPPYSQDLAPADFFLFPIVKRKLASLTIAQWMFKKEWEGALPRHSAVGFSAMRSVSPLAADMSRKPRNTNQPSYYCFLLISLVRIISKPTL
jgi:hypothetical protein